MSVTICAIAAMDSERVIGYNNKLPWHLPEDLNRFKQLTTGATVLMGRKTYESLPEKFKPLPGRQNVILSSSWKKPPLEGVKVIDNLEKYLSDVKSGIQQISSDKLWIIGGQQVYNASLAFWDRLYLTRIAGSYLGDSFFPHFEDEFELIDTEIGSGCAFEVYQRKTVTVHL